MYEGMPLSQLEATEKIPQGSSIPVVMGDGSGVKKVTKETLSEETGNALKVGNLEELLTDNKESIVKAINELKGVGGGASVDILDTQEEIEANTESGKVAGALAVQDMFSALNDKLTLPDGTNIYFDMKDGVFGYNTDPERGADTFHPFSNGIGGGVLIWENPNPNNGFNAQTIDIPNLSHYQYIKIESFGGSNMQSNGALPSTQIYKNVENNTLSAYYNDNYISMRSMKISGDNITFSLGYVSGSATSNSAYCIPYKIFGL